jgi:hypothetical protein
LNSNSFPRNRFFSNQKNELQTSCEPKKVDVLICFRWDFTTKLFENTASSATISVDKTEKSYIFTQILNMTTMCNQKSDITFKPMKETIKPEKLIYQALRIFITKWNWLISNIDIFIDFSILNNLDDHELLSKIVSENEFPQDLFSQNSEIKRYIENSLVCFEEKAPMISMISFK